MRSAFHSRSRGANWRCWWVFGLGLASDGIVLAEPKQASDTEEVRAQLELVARADCATYAELVRRIGFRSSRIRFVAGSEPVRRLVADIERRAGEGVRVVLRVLETNGKRSSRELVAQSCGEALDALALVAAMTLDPSAALDRPAAQVEREAPLESQASPHQDSPARVEALPLTSTKLERSSQPSPSALPPQKSELKYGVGVGMSGVFGPAPGLMPGAISSICFEWQRGSIWSPRTRLAASLGELRGIEAPGGKADFVLGQLLLELCPTWLGSASLGVSFCAMGAMGVLRASGSETHSPRSQSRPWRVLGVSAGLAYRPSRRLELGGTLGAGYPLVRDRFEFRPRVFYEVPPLILVGGLVFGPRFP